MRRRRVGENTVTERGIKPTIFDETAIQTMALGPGATSVRNRTSEFLAAAEAVRTTLSANGKLNDTKPIAPRSRGEFTTLAAQVGKKIQETSVRLSKLTKLAQRKSLYDDPTSEIQELTFAIKRDIGQLNSQLGTLQKLRDIQRRNANKQAGDHSESVVVSLKGRLLSTAKGFKEVMRIREESLAAQRDRRSQFLGSAASGADFGRGNAALDLGGGSLGANVHSGGVVNGTQGAQGLSMIQAPQENRYQTARVDAVRQVESTVVELEQIFNQLATMVSEQGELVERIDANVEDTAVNMHAGHAQLIRYFNSIAGNRALILKVFGVLLFFLVLWTVIT